MLGLHEGEDFCIKSGEARLNGQIVFDCSDSRSFINCFLQKT